MLKVPRGGISAVPWDYVVFFPKQKTTKSVNSPIQNVGIQLYNNLTVLTKASKMSIQKPNMTKRQKRI